MSRHSRSVVVVSLLIAPAAAFALVACSGANSSNPQAAAPSATLYAGPNGYGYPPGATAAPGYPTAAPGYPTAAPGYPTAAPGYPTAAPGYPTAAPTYAPTAPPGYPTAAPTYAPTAPPGYPTAPPATPPPSTGGGSAQALDPNFAGPAIAIVNALAAADAPGMTKEGTGLAGNFQAGQTLEQPITIQPGRCYTFIAAGVGPQEVEVSLVAQAVVPGLPGAVMGDQKGSGGKVVLGAGSSCVKLALIPVAVPAKWVITATKGAGLVGGQAYSK